MSTIIGAALDEIAWKLSVENEGYEFILECNGLVRPMFCTCLKYQGINQFDSILSTSLLSSLDSNILLQWSEFTREEAT